jgi:NAD(P)-dependent dehydrogenase (short-subunit alcohol dehydrogenase family)
MVGRKEGGGGDGDDDDRETILLTRRGTVDAEEPQEPKLNIININLIGVLYTIKLALHYFRRQNALNKGDPLDQVLVLQGSLAGYLDLPGAVQYIASKFGLRGIMRSLRRTEHAHNIRVNYIGPWYVLDSGCAFATI